MFINGMIFLIHFIINLLQLIIQRCVYMFENVLIRISNCIFYHALKSLKSINNFEEKMKY